MNEKQYYTYILASQKNGTLYVGVTSDLLNRVADHKSGRIEGFTKRYNIKLLVYYEIFGDVYMAINREKQLKKWNRSWKINLIEKENPGWEDLYKRF
ncbi:GIY-YIG nuclease family protein [Candidatus Falkowbacteria bacterium]|nr:GIY-YIG nuclease family protein [Candidatus Falkowbacteria bacterium]